MTETIKQLFSVYRDLAAKETRTEIVKLEYVSIKPKYVRAVKLTPAQGNSSYIVKQSHFQETITIKDTNEVLIAIGFQLYELTMGLRDTYSLILASKEFSDYQNNIKLRYYKEIKGEQNK